MTAEKTASKTRTQWEASAFTDNELVVLLATMTKTAPAKATPKNIRELVIAEALKAGVDVSEAKAILRRAMTPGDATATKASAKPQPARNPVKDSPKQRPHPGVPPKHPAPEKKRASAVVKTTGQTKPQIILNAIRAKTGASLTTLMNLTGWQAHSVRGCIATLKTQGGYGIDSEKRGTERMYTLITEPQSAPVKKQAAAQRRKPAPRVTKPKARAKKTAAKRKAG